MGKRNYTRPKPRPVRVTLSCGCVTRTRTEPYRWDTKFACDSGARHGYRLGWVDWSNTVTGRAGTNEPRVGGRRG